MKTPQTFAAAAAGPVSDRTPLTPVIPRDSGSARPVGDRSCSSGAGASASRTPWIQGALLGLLAAALLAGCGSRPESAAQADAAGHGAEPPPAVVFKAGRGLQLSATSAEFIGLATAEVTTRDLPGARGATAIPNTALLRTVRGDFVFVSNGGWLLCTPVVVGAADSGWSEVKDGLYEGDTVVALGTRALWLAEIQAVNGGVSCTHGH